MFPENMDKNLKIVTVYSHESEQLLRLGVLDVQP
jgi:hypothetical protein